MIDKTQLAEALFVAHLSSGTVPVVRVEQARSVWRASVRRDIDGTLRNEYEEFAAAVLAELGRLDLKPSVDVATLGIPGLTDEERARFDAALADDEPEVLASLTWGDDQDTLVLRIGETEVATLRGALKSTSEEVAGWLAENYVKHEGSTAGYAPADVAESLRTAARHLSAAADRVEEVWG